MMSTPESLAVAASKPQAAGQPLATLSRLAGRVLSVWAIPLVLSALTFVVLSPTIWNGFVEWDDQMNLYENPDYRGLGAAQFRYFFTTVLMGHYIPLTWSTFGLDYVLWGMNPMGYHLTSLVLFAANAAALYFVALRLLQKTGALTGGPLRLGAVAATLFFTLHPLRAESVAWATERRDVLSGLFFLLTLLVYLRMCDAGGARRPWLLAAAVGLYVLALTSKGSVMVLPGMLIVLDIYPLRRFSRQSLLETIPFAVLGIAGAAVTYYAQNANRFITPLESYPLSWRPGVVFFSLWFYVEKTVVPLGLSPLYELPARVHPLTLRFLLPAVAVIAITATLVALRRRWPAGLAVWAYYAIGLGPVIGIIHSGHQLTHDRYSYLPGIGLALLFGGVAGVLARQTAAGAIRPLLAWALAVAGVVWVAGLATLTFQQAQVWRDTDTLWRYALDSQPDCSVCHANLGVYLGNQGFVDEARKHFLASLAIRPDQLKTYHFLGFLHMLKGEFKEAAEDLRRYLGRYPNDVDALVNLGATLMALHQHREALEVMERAAKIKPNGVYVNTNLGFAIGENGRPAESLQYFRRAIALKWDMAQAWAGLARFFAEAGQPQAALTAHGILRMINPAMASRIGPVLLTAW